MDWFTYMFVTYEQEDLQRLRQANFPDRAIIRLCHLRKTYGQDAMDQPALDLRRLKFVRFLVKTGRLNEQIRSK